MAWCRTDDKPLSDQWSPSLVTLICVNTQHPPPHPTHPPTPHPPTHTPPTPHPTHPPHTPPTHPTPHPTPPHTPPHHHLPTPPPFTHPHPHPRGISIIKIRRSYDGHIFIMRISIQVRRHIDNDTHTHTLAGIPKVSKCRISKTVHVFISMRRNFVNSMANSVLTIVPSSIRS